MISKKWLLPILLPIQILFIKWISGQTEWIETKYSLGIYPKISAFLRYLLGWIPFSVGDVLISLLLINVIVFIVKKVIKRKVSFVEVIRKVLSITSVVYFLFHFCWGLNYYRKPLHQVLQLDKSYTTEQLEKVCYFLAEESNKLHLKLENRDSIAVNVPYNRKEIFEKTSDAYNELKVIFPKLEYHPRSVKPTLYSKIQLYLGFSGYINPITNEAQVNRYLLPYKLPTTSCHEEAHQLGFAKENEANFIGALACMNSNDPYFKYSGYTFALRFCISELYRRDYEKYDCVRLKIRKGIYKNYQETRDFWKPYENPFEPLMKVFYGNFLKANNQPQGIKSYSYVVALFVNYFNMNSF